MIDAPGIVMFCTGAIVRSGDRKQKAALLAILRQHASDRDRVDPLASQGSTRRDHEVQQHPQRISSAFENRYMPATDIGRYATALKEHGDQYGFVPTYEVVELSSVPPQFQATATVEGSSFEGIAKTKKQARHEAAKKACLTLHIKV